MVASTLENWAIRDVGDRPHKLFLHFFESPVEVLGEDGRVVGLRTERTELDGTGNVKGTGTFKRLGRAGCLPGRRLPLGELPKLPFDDDTAPSRRGRPRPGGRRAGRRTYVTGWIKRGPVGLIGHTKGDANETVAACSRTSAAAG